jgi:DnaJ-class molecular chaperone
MEFRDYYATLGVPRTATEKEIRTAFRKLARKHHPDVNPGDPSAEERFKEANEAYEVLSDPEKRMLYDELGANWKQYAQAGAPPPGAAGGPFGGWTRTRSGGRSSTGAFSEDDISDLFGDESPFSDFFEQYFGSARQAPSRPRGGSDAETPVEVTLAEAYSGATRVISFRSEDGKERRIEAKIPAGVTDGSRVRLAGQGLPGRSGGQAGDLYLVISVTPDPRFTREGADLRVRVTAPLATLVLGGTTRVPKPDGRSLELTVKPGSQDGQVYRLRGQGMPRRPGAKERGDLLAEIHVYLPTSPSPRERELLEQLAQLGKPAGAGVR